MLILKFLKYQENLSGSSTIVVEGVNINGYSSYSIRISDLSQNEKVIMISSNKDKTITTEIKLDNISCSIFKDSIFFTTTDRTADGRIEFKNFYTQVPSTLSSIIVLNERTDPLTFFQLDLVSVASKLTASVKKMGYSEAELKQQDINMYHLVSILETLKLYSLIDDQAFNKICKDALDKLQGNFNVLQDHLQESLDKEKELNLLIDKLNADKATLETFNEHLSSLLDKGCLDGTNATILQLEKEIITNENRIKALEKQLEEALSSIADLEKANKLLFDQKALVEKENRELKTEKIQLEAKYRDLLQIKNRVGYIILTSMRFRRNSSETSQPNTIYLISEPNSLNEKANFIIFKDSSIKEIHLLGSQNSTFNPHDENNPYHSKGYYYLLKIKYDDSELHLDSLFGGLLEAATGAPDLYYLRLPIPSSNVTVLGTNLAPGHIESLLIGEINKKLK